MRLMKLGFVGLGVVGGAVAKAFASHFDTVGYDIRTSPDTKEDLLKTEIMFLSLPTATVGGAQDQQALQDTGKWLGERGYKGIVVVKSTVLPGTCQQLANEYGIRVVHNPEFLTEKNALADFMNQPVVLLGGYIDDVMQVADVYRVVLPDSEMRLIGNSQTTEIAKYTHNLFLATKIGFLNEIYKVCEKVGVKYDAVIAAALTQDKIGETHTKVPNIAVRDNTATFGFAGMCFPKDIQALLTWAKAEGLDLEQINATNEANLKIRPETSLK